MLCEIPIPDGWEFVGYRRAKPGESIFENNKITHFHDGSNAQYIVIRKQWQPPDFLPDGWIAMDANGEWYWFESTPRLDAIQWMAGMNNFEIVRETIWERPPVTDWKESLREIKRDQAQPKVAL